MEILWLLVPLGFAVFMFILVDTPEKRAKRELEWNDKGDTI
jgi:hypothetical protein